MKKSHTSKNLLSELDLDVLKLIDKQNCSVSDVEEKLNINPLSAKRHVRRLTELKLIKRETIEKTNRANLSITQYGKELLKLFDKLLS
ncbi:MAG: hypothetical protein QW727_02380 [Candidatus Pacearchaeota archaeon]